MRLAAIRALEIRDEAAIIRGTTRGELEARIFDAERVQASAPPDVSRRLRLTAQAEADAWQQSVDATTRHHQAEAVNARALAGQLATERQQLEISHADYERWSTATAGIRETAVIAQTELKRRNCTVTPESSRSPVPAARTDRLGALSARAASLAAAGRQARFEYSARIERESQMLTESLLVSQAQHDTEMGQ
jgi:hypothetical protein